MNPIFAILLILGLSMGMLAGRFHETREITLEQKEQKYKPNELKAEQFEGIEDSSKDTIIKLL